jgi:CheY-like chemotaxis protein
MSGFAGKVALVTGAGGMKGIGRSVALELARHGADLVLAQSAALDLASAGITVNCVCPGPVNTGRLSRWERAQAEQAGIPLEAFRTRVVAEAAGATPLGRIAEPEEVATAREGLTAARRARPTVLVCDIAMPGGDGFSMIQELRSGETGDGRIPALAPTAYARPEDRERALAAGFDLHLAKPVEPADLVRAVARLAGRARLA